MLDRLAGSPGSKQLCRLGDPLRTIVLARGGTGEAPEDHADAVKVAAVEVGQRIHHSVRDPATFRSDGWIYFLAQGPDGDQAMATDAAVLLANQ